MNTGRIESDGTVENTQIWLGDVEVTNAVHRIEWGIDARGGVEALVTLQFVAKGAQVSIDFMEEKQTNATQVKEDPQIQGAPLFRG